VRIQLDSLTIAIAGDTAPSSTTIGSVGAYVLAVATTLPDRAFGLTSCYLARPGGQIAATHLQLNPDGTERLTAQVIPPPAHIAEHARACLLDHAAELQHRLAEFTSEQVLVDVGAGALDRAAEAWGPATPEP
jgi:hypothetical protein